MARYNKSTAQEHAREEAIPQCSHAVAQHTDEPEKGDTGDGHQAQGQGHGLGLLLQPGTTIGRIGRDGDADKHIGSDEQHGEKDAGNGRSARRLESHIGQGTVLFVHDPSPT